MGLLQELLALEGGLPPDRLARLRSLPDRCVREALGEVTMRLWPALSRLGRARPTRHPGSLLDLFRTGRPQPARRPLLRRIASSRDRS